MDNVKEDSDIVGDGGTRVWSQLRNRQMPTKRLVGRGNNSLVSSLHYVEQQEGYHKLSCL